MYEISTIFVLFGLCDSEIFPEGLLGKQASYYLGILSTRRAASPIKSTSEVACFAKLEKFTQRHLPIPALVFT